jgi:hypothetical protein
VRRPDEDSGGGLLMADLASLAIAAACFVLVFGLLRVLERV